MHYFSEVGAGLVVVLELPEVGDDGRDCVEIKLLGHAWVGINIIIFVFRNNHHAKMHKSGTIMLMCFEI